MKKTAVILITVTVGILLSGCGKKPQKTTDKETGKPVAYTTFYPAKYFTERIAGELIDVVCPVPEDEDAIFWMPDTETIAKYQKADLIIINGADFSKWINKVSLPDQRIVNTAKPLKETFIYYEQATEHSHGKSGKHAHEGLDGHTWVDPVNASVQANEIKKALVKHFPKHKIAFEEGFNALEENLATLDSKLKSFPDKNKPLLTSHPAYNYIARNYGWSIHNLDLDPEEMPSDKAIQEIKEILKNHHAKFLIWEAQPKKIIADRLQNECSLTSIVFSPCELISEADLANKKDYMTVMLENIKNITPAFTEEK